MTTDSLSRLINAIAPPLRPTGIVKSWEMVEQDLQLALPADYKRFISAYGTGGFFPFELFIWNLLEESLDLDFIRSQNDFAHDAETDSVSFQQFQNSTPVFPIGADGVGSEFFWGQDGSPDDWYMIVVKGGLKYHRFPGVSVTEFLVALFLDKSPSLTALWGGNSNVAQQAFIPAPPK